MELIAPCDAMYLIAGKNRKSHRRSLMPDLYSNETTSSIVRACIHIATVAELLENGRTELEEDSFRWSCLLSWITGASTTTQAARVDCARSGGDAEAAWG